MSPESILSQILSNKFYSRDEISQTRLTIQQNSGCKMTLLNPRFDQILLDCPHKTKKDCPFSYLFQRVEQHSGPQSYDLILSNENHSNLCSFFKPRTELQDRTYCHLNLQKSVSLSQNTESGVGEKSFSQIQENASLSSKQKIPDHQSVQSEEVYFEENFCLLKKELELSSRGMLSKSTEYEEKQTAQIQRVHFYCKYEADCPYSAELVKSDKSGSKDRVCYNLIIKNASHLPQCLMDKEEINYNQNTLRIDKEIDSLTKIVVADMGEMKPKDILKKLAVELGEESQEFIYQGLSSKLKKRAIKKYFDNTIAKIRGKIGTPVTSGPQSPKQTSGVFQIRKSNIHKKDSFSCSKEQGPMGCLE